MDSPPQASGELHSGGAGAHHDGSSSPSHAPSRYWAETEHARFLEALLLYGSKDVRAIASHVQTRNATQVRTHAQKYYLRLAREAARLALNKHDGGERPLENEEMWAWFCASNPRDYQTGALVPAVAVEAAKEQFRNQSLLDALQRCGADSSGSVEGKHTVTPEFEEMGMAAAVPPSPTADAAARRKRRRNKNAGTGAVDQGATDTAAQGGALGAADADGVEDLEDAATMPNLPSVHAADRDSIAELLNAETYRTTLDETLFPASGAPSPSPTAPPRDTPSAPPASSRSSEQRRGSSGARRNATGRRDEHTAGAVPPEPPVPTLPPPSRTLAEHLITGARPTSPMLWSGFGRPLDLDSMSSTAENGDGGGNLDEYFGAGAEAEVGAGRDHAPSPLGAWPTGDWELLQRSLSVLAQDPQCEMRARQLAEASRLPLRTVGSPAVPTRAPVPLPTFWAVGGDAGSRSSSPGARLWRTQSVPMLDARVERSAAGPATTVAPTGVEGASLSGSGNALLSDVKARNGSVQSILNLLQAQPTAEESPSVAQAFLASLAEEQVERLSGMLYSVDSAASLGRSGGLAAGAAATMGSGGSGGAPLAHHLRRDSAGHVAPTTSRLQSEVWSWRDDLRPALGLGSGVGGGSSASGSSSNLPCRSPMLHRAASTGEFGRLFHNRSFMNLSDASL